MVAKLVLDKNTYTAWDQILGTIPNSKCYESESEGRSVMADLLQPHGLYPWNSPGQSTGVGSLSLPQGIFPTQVSNPGLPRCRQILYQLSHKGSKCYRSHYIL